MSEPVLDRDTVAGRVVDFPRVAADRPDLKQAAVALCVTERDGVPTLVITRRAAGAAGARRAVGAPRRPARRR